MAIENFKCPVQDPEAQARAVGNIKAQFTERVRTHGIESAKAQLAALGVEPSLQDVREAERAATSAEYQALRTTNPIAAAHFAAAHPGVHTPSPAPPQPTAAESFAASRSRVAAAPPVRDPASAAWVSTNLEGGK